MVHYLKEKLINYNIINKSMLKYPISTLLYLAKINIKDKIQDTLRLHNNLDIRLTVTVKDKDGKIIKQHKQRSHSFVSNFLALIAQAMLNQYNNVSNFYGYKGAGGNVQFVSTDSTPGLTTIENFMTMLDSANDSSYGIVVGTGTSPPTPNDYTMENEISNGTGTGQLVYGSHSVSPPGGTTSSPTLLTPSGNVTSFTVSRTFQNQSGASITVSEVGIFIKQYAQGGNIITVLITHDLLSSAITIPNGGVMAITYTISVTT